MASPTTSPLRSAKVPRSNPAKARLLELLAKFFCLRAKDAAKLLRNRAATKADRRSVNRTLSLLHRDGFVCRLDAGFAGATHYVYGLSEKGVNHAIANGYSTATTKTLDEHSLRTLDHELEITRFHMALHELCEASGLSYTWRQTDLKHTIHPDAFFSVTEPTDPEREFCYFLEVERSKYGNYRDGEPQILRKLAAFYAYFNSTDCEKEWGFRQFRVIVVQRTDARREGLLKALRAQHNHRMFWLTTESAYRADIGGAIWRTPKDDAPVTFSFLSR